MGVVYEARDERLGRLVAIKRVRAFSGDATLRDRLVREARTAAAISHPNICQVYELGEEGEELFVVMELLDGETLAARVARGPIVVNEALQIALGILAALEAMHSRGIVHRDLKPSNVFLTPHGVKLLDFGLARPPALSVGDLEVTPKRHHRGLAALHGAGAGAGGDPIDARTDVFATGAVLFEALAGRVAFAGTTAVEVMHATLHEQPPALAGPPAVVAFDRVVRRALAKSPAERYPTAIAMSRDLEAIPIGDSGASAAPARALTRLVVLPFRVLRPDPEIDFLGLALADAVSSSLSGLSLSRRAFECSGLPLLRRGSGPSGDRHPARRGPGAAGHIAPLGRAPEGLDAARGGPRRDAHLVTHDGVAGRGGVPSPGRARTGNRRVALALARRLGDRASARESPTSARAYEYYLRANAVVRDLTKLPVARDLYLQCVAEDPGFAPAWARLGRAHRIIGKYLEIPQLATHQAKAEEALRRALELSPRLPLAHNDGAPQSGGGRAQEAMVRLLGLAAETRNDAELFAGLVHACRYSGLLEASLEADRRARRIDPGVRTSVHYTYWMLGATSRRSSPTWRTSRCSGT